MKILEGQQTKKQHQFGYPKESQFTDSKETENKLTH
jgi:hypothetical protein